MRKVVFLLFALISVVFGGFYKAKRMKYPYYITDVFGRMDHNKDGQVTIEEMKQTFMPSAEEYQVAHFFKRADRNGDGIITIQEYYLTIDGPQEEIKLKRPGQKDDNSTEEVPKDEV
eukprot:TRINITY_DN9426_c0_g1_i1.p1 TRINITY_DN9426_c0_g1~~TRINITY_DN9426_c0_g1_i1.p1  ORF type:complete len:117 (+),score=33.14 TRINITY_DN9426_c0_g1_i1:153-503(+)